MDHSGATSGDATIDALRGPALPFEQARQGDDVAAMLEAYAQAPALFTSRRLKRRGVAIAMVTIASLGAGGVLVAGPGSLLPAADTPGEPVPPADQEPAVRTTDGGVERHSTDPLVTCAEGNHGATVSSVAQAGGDVPAAAHSQCGKPINSNSSGDDADAGDAPDATNGVERHTNDPNVTCAEGNHGRTVSSVAQAGGDVPAAAHSQCGKPINSNSGGDDAPDEQDVGADDEGATTETDQPGPPGTTGRPDDPGSQAGEHPAADPTTPAEPPAEATDTPDAPPTHPEPPTSATPAGGGNPAVPADPAARPDTPPGQVSDPANGNGGRGG